MGESAFKGTPRVESRILEILRRLDSEFEISWPDAESPFLVLVRTVLSQNTNRLNAKRAFENLTSKYVDPSDFVGAEIGELEDLIRPAGLYKSKSRHLKKIAEIVLDRYDGDLGKVLDRPTEKARGELLEMPGVGPKTADCVLLFAGDRDVLPVDTHVNRTAKRLGLVNLGKGSEGVKTRLEAIIPENERGKAHLLFIELGREFCKAPSPACEACPIAELCPKAGLE